MNTLDFLKRALACASSAIAMTVSAGAQQGSEFNIEEQPLATALVEFSNQAGVTVVASSKLTDGKLAGPLSGESNPSTALKTLLDGSGLVARFDDDASIIYIAQETQVQETPVVAPSQRQAEVETDEIVVKGFRSALRSSLDAKRSANQVIDTINAEEIGQFPDQNIAESIQRITGVQITRNNGEGESINIRGLSPNFTRVEVDGRSTTVTIDSSEPERASVLSVFTSDLYNSIEVVKSPTAADVEGGVGGIVRLKTPDPLTIGKLTWGVDGGAIYGEQRDMVEPTFSGFYSNVFADERIGVLLAGTFDRRDRRLDKIQSNQNWIAYDADGETDPTLIALDGGRFPGRLRQERREGKAPKYNFNAKLQFQATDALELYANGVYTNEQREEDRSRIQATFSRGDLLGGTLDESTGALVEAQFDRHRTEFLSFVREADIETIGATGGLKFETDDWKIKAEGSFQSSEEDFRETRASHRTNRDGLGGYSILNDAEYPELFTAATQEAFEDLDVRDLDQQRRIISLEEVDAEIDIERFVDFGPITSIRFGGRYASTEFDRRQGQVQSPEEGNLTYADGVAFFDDVSFAEGFGDADLLRDWPAIDPVELYNRFPSTDPFVFDDENLWTIKEDSFAGYVMANYDATIGGWIARGNLGVRLVQTDYSGQGRVNIQSSDLTPEFDPDGNEEVFLDDEPTIDRGYFEPLPSFNIVLSPSEDSDFQFRAAVSRALSRPTINEINPGVEINTDDGDIVRGNPELDPFTAWQYDAGIEYYFADESAFSVAYFYKDVSNFIVADGFEETIAFPQVGLAEQTYQVDTFQNGGDAKIQGVEVGLQTPFYFLPGFWSDFGVFANYTFTDSEFTNEEGVTQSFPGASRHAYNLVGYYERDGFSARVAYNYRDDFLLVPAQTDSNSANAEFGDSQGRLDVALRYRMDNGIRLSFDVLNLTEEQNYIYYDTPQRLEDLEVEGRIYTFRVGYIF